MSPCFTSKIRSLLAASGLMAAAAAWGQAPALPTPAVPAAAPAPAPRDTAGPDKDGRIRAQISAQQQTSLSAELAAKIANLPLREGDAFKAGQMLVAFDCSLFRAQLAKAEASAEAARQTLRVNRRLLELNSISSLEVDQAAAKVKETEAEASAMRVTVGKCSLPAPYSGRIAKVHVESHQYVTQGKPLLDIVDTQRLEVRLIVPSKWLAWVRQGTRFNIRVDDLARDYAVKVSRLGARIDPVNQTVFLAGEVEGSHPELLPGMSGWASFSIPK